jgi:hypothetical protein
MARPDGDSFLVELPADIFRAAIGKHKREHTHLLAGGADQL